MHVPFEWTLQQVGGLESEPERVNCFRRTFQGSTFYFIYATPITLHTSITLCIHISFEGLMNVTLPAAVVNGVSRQHVSGRYKRTGIFTGKRSSTRTVQGSTTTLLFSEVIRMLQQVPGSSSSSGRWTIRASSERHYYKRMGTFQRDVTGERFRVKANDTNRWIDPERFKWSILYRHLSHQNQNLYIIGIQLFSCGSLCTSLKKRKAIMRRRGGGGNE